MGIGEHVWLGEIDENSFHNIDDPNCERRKKVASLFTPHKPPPSPALCPRRVMGARGGELVGRGCLGDARAAFSRQTAATSSAGSGE